MGNLTANVHPGIIRISPPAYTGSYTVTPDEQGEVLETNGKVMTNDVTVNPVPWVKPEGSKNITTNGTHDVEAYKNAVVAVPGPSGTKTITTNGTHDVEAYESVNVQVPQGVFPQGTLNISQNGTFNVTNYESAEVNTDPEKGIVYSDWANDGYPRTATIFYDGALPLAFCRKMGWGDGLSYTSAGVDYYINKIVLQEGITAIGNRTFEYCSAILEITIPSTVQSLMSNSFVSCSSLKKVVFNCDITSEINLNLSGYEEQLIFNRDIYFWTKPASTSIVLYDFSHCANVFTLSAVSSLPHASGCVILVPATLLTAWQNETNWNALTDVVWEGV